MSGFEVVGVVLAILPLIITAVENYGACLEDYARYGATLERLRIRLKLDQEIFRDTIKRILISSLSQKELDTFFPDEQDTNAAVACWATASIEESLRKRLGSNCSTFVDTIGKMRETLEALMNKLDLDTEGKPKWQTENTASGNSATQAPTGLGWEWTKIRHSFGSKKRGKLLRTFEEYNEIIGRWVENKEILSAREVPEGQAKLFVEYFGRVRSHACGLYSILRKNWICECDVRREANLELDERLDEQIHCQHTPTFKVSFPFRSVPQHTFEGESSSIEAYWKETEIEIQDLDEGTLERLALEEPSLESLAHISLNQGASARSAPVNFSRPRKRVAFQNTLKTTSTAGAVISVMTSGLHSPAFLRIKCLCEALRDAQRTAKYVGAVTDPLNKRVARIKEPSAPSPSGPLKKTLPLSLLLRSTNATPTPGYEFGPLSRQQRLGLAVVLASAVLQLHDTPWMNEQWGKNDIHLFFNGVDNDKCPSISNPHVTRTFTSPFVSISNASGTNNAEDIIFSTYIINKSLFALGIVLIELCLNIPFEDLRARAHPENPNATPNILDDYEIAISVVDEVYSEGGDQYGYVVSRCLRCEFQGQNSQKRLDLNGFKIQVYEKILVPLRDDYKHFSLPVF